jgi:predicted branched-subunit amino acid permease
VGPAPESPKSLLVATLPIGAAIAVFGVVYGATAAPVLGVAETVVSSVLIFSGALQFATVGLAATGAGPVVILLTALALNVRHIVLGVLLRSRLEVSRTRRAFLAWFLVDETFGLSFAAPSQPARTLLVAGVICYVGWVAGTVAGVLGASVGGVSGLAEAMFPVLFIGLSALTSASRDVAIRSGVAAALVVVAVLALPELRPAAPLIAAVVVALPGQRS